MTSEQYAKIIYENPIALQYFNNPYGKTDDMDVIEIIKCLYKLQKENK